MMSKNPSDDFQVIELCHGRTTGDRPFHAFIKMTVNEYADYHEKLAAKQPFDLNACGNVIYTGWGSTPDKRTAAKILRDHTDNLKILEGMRRIAADHDAIIRKNSKEGQ